MKLCKTAFIKYFKNYNKELFNYCKFIKQDKSKWKGFKSPYQFLAKKEEFKDNSYIRDFFTDLHNEGKNKKKYEDVKKKTDYYNLFEENINIYIDEMCNTYFDLNNNNDDDNDW